MSLQAILNEIKTNGAATSLDVARALGIPLKRASTYLERLYRKGRLKKGELQHGATGRPARIWWPT